MQNSSAGPWIGKGVASAHKGLRSHSEGDKGDCCSVDREEVEEWVKESRGEYSEESRGTKLTVGDD